MDELDDLAAFGLAEIDEDRAAGEWDDPHAPVAAAALTTAQAVDLARWTIGEGEPPEWYSAWTIDRDEDMARTILAWAPIVAAAEAQERIMSGLGHDQKWMRVYDEATERTESAVRAMQAAGGGA